MKRRTKIPNEQIQNWENLLILKNSLGGGKWIGRETL